MSYLQNLYSNAVNLNRNNIRKLLERNSKAVFVDLGCDDGKFTKNLARQIHPKETIGIDIISTQLQKARKRNIKVIKSDLNEKLPLKNNSADVIVANQVIEHVSNLDMFMREIHRVLKPNGYTIISTENASSWCNVFSVLLGWQMFSLTNISSKKLGIGNPFALHRNEKINLDSWTHKTIFSIRGLIEFSQAWGFKVTAIRGAGLFPFPAFFGAIDKTHAHFITVKIQKI